MIVDYISYKLHMQVIKKHTLKFQIIPIEQYITLYIIYPFYGHLT